MAFSLAMVVSCQYVPFVWPKDKTESQATNDALNHLNFQIDLFLMCTMCTSLNNLKIQLSDFHLNNVKITLDFTEKENCCGIFDGCFHSIGVAWEELIFKNIKGIIELKTLIRSAIFGTRLSGQFTAQILATNKHSDFPVFLLITDLMNFFSFWYFEYDPKHKIVNLKKFSKFTASNIFKMIHFWIEHIYSRKETNDKDCNKREYIDSS